MTANQLVGATLIALPFIALFGWIWYDSGFKVACGVFGASLATLSLICLGVHLLK